MLYAIYRGLYGEDFIEDSVASITEFVDRIFFFLDPKPWGDVTSCEYKGGLVQFPKTFDNYFPLVNEIAQGNPKVSIQYDHQYNNIGQFTHLINERILPYCQKPDVFLIVEPDHVWRQDELEKALRFFRDSGAECGLTRQIEVWKGFRHIVPPRPQRTGGVFWSLHKRDRMPATMRQAEPAESGCHIVRIDAYVHNMGFAVSEEAMFWKHMIALGMSQKIRDSRPRPDWYENVWMEWEPGMRNLEISIGAESDIPMVYESPVDQLPKAIQERLE